MVIDAQIFSLLSPLGCAVYIVNFTQWCNPSNVLMLKTLDG